MSRACKPVLEKLPSEIAEQIVGELDFVSKICVRKTCRNFQNAVNDRKVENALFMFDCSEDSIRIYWPEKDCFEYDKHSDGCCVKYRDNNIKKEKVIQGEDFITCAMRDLATTLSIPKLSLEVFDITHDLHSDTKQFVEPLKAILRSRDNKLSVKDLQILMNLDQDDIFDFLSLVKPGTLENVSITQSENNFNLGRIAELPQWKQAKSLHMRIGNEPIDSFLHFQDLDLEYRNELSLEDATKLVNAAVEQDDKFAKFSISECECDYHIGGYLEQIGSTLFPLPYPPPQFGPVNTRGREDDEFGIREARSCFEPRYIAIQNSEFSLMVQWNNTSFTVKRVIPYDCD